MRYKRGSPFPSFRSLIGLDLRFGAGRGQIERNVNSGDLGIGKQRTGSGRDHGVDKGTGISLEAG